MISGGFSLGSQGRVRVELGGLEPPTPCMPCRCSSQLSYSPIELVILGKVNAGPLAVLRGPQPKLHLPLADEQRLGQKVATVDGSAVDREQVDLRPLVARPHVACRR